MKKIALLVLIFSIGVGCVALVGYSIIKGASAMREENMLLLVVDETEENKVEMGVGIITDNGGKPFLIELGGMVQGKRLQTLLSGDIERAGERLISKNIPGYDITKDEPILEEAAFDRFVFIPTSVLKELMDRMGGVDFGSSESGEERITRFLKGDDVARILRAEGFSDTGTWKIAYRDPHTGKEVTKNLEGQEFGDFLSRTPGMDREKALTYVKFLTLNSVTDGIKERNRIDPTFTSEVIEVLLRNYKEGSVEVYPSNTLTRAIKYLPSSAVDKLAQIQG